MERQQALIVSFLVVLAAGYVLPLVFDWGLGFELPFFGFFGVKPLEFLEEYFAWIMGVIGVTVMYFMYKGRKQQ